MPSCLCILFAVAPICSRAECLSPLQSRLWSWCLEEVVADDVE